MSVLFTFPGQGAQTPGMLHALPQHPAVATTLVEASTVLGRDVMALDSAEALRSTTAVQLALLVAGVAAARRLAAEGALPDMLLGLSIGAYPAAVMAGVLEFADAVRLVELRGQLMEQAYPDGYGMTAIMGLPAHQLEPILDRLRGQGHAVYLANLNSETQMVVAGSEAAMALAVQRAVDAGALTSRRVRISVPSHCPLLDAPAQRLGEAFKKITLRPPQRLLLSASAARALWEPARIAEDLATNMARQVRWYEAAGLAYARGARLAVEMPPGNVLTGLVAPIMAGEGIALSFVGNRLDTLRVLITREHASDCGG